MEPDAPHGADGVFFHGSGIYRPGFSDRRSPAGQFSDDHHPFSDKVRDGPGRGQPLLRHGLYAE